MPDSRDQIINAALTTTDPAKRRFLKTLLAGAGFAAPLVASFSMKGVSSYTVQAAQFSNISM